MQSLTAGTANDMDVMIQSYIFQGYAIAHKSETSVTLVKKKSFNWLIATAGFIFLLIGFFVYLGVYMIKKDQIVTITVNKQKSVQAA